MAANALIKQLEIEDTLMNNRTGKGAAVATGLAKAALQLKDGNYTERQRSFPPLLSDVSPWEELIRPPWRP